MFLRNLNKIFQFFSILGNTIIYFKIYLTLRLLKNVCKFLYCSSLRIVQFVINFYFLLLLFFNFNHFYLLEGDFNKNMEF